MLSPYQIKAKRKELVYQAEKEIDEAIVTKWDDKDSASFSLPPSFERLTTVERLSLLNGYAEVGWRTAKQSTSTIGVNILVFLA